MTSNRRSQEKYPALKRELNLKVRRYYIESSYIDGVYDENGKEVIRPLNEKEKEFLNKFYAEVVCTSFKNDDTDFYKTKESRKEIYSENNARNRCLYNNKQKMGKLISLDVDKYDQLMQKYLDHIDPDLFVVKELWVDYEEDE